MLQKTSAARDGSSEEGVCMWANSSFYKAGKQKMLGRETKNQSRTASITGLQSGFVCARVFTGSFFGAVGMRCSAVRVAENISEGTERYDFKAKTGPTDYPMCIHVVTYSQHSSLSLMIPT